MAAQEEAQKEALMDSGLTVEYRPCRLRALAAWVWTFYMGVTAAWWLGLTGVGLVLVAATPMLRRSAAGQPRLLHLTACAISPADGLRDYWRLPGMLCICAGGHRHWLFRDEVQPAQWSALKRYLKLQLPAQAVGLSMSK